jgi:iron complex transport system permease protein
MRDSSKWLIYGALLLGLVGACALSMFAGAVSVPATEMIWPWSGIVQMRVARILLAIVAGAGLSVSGVVFQALFRNPLAEPYVLGVSSGAGLGAVAAIFLNLAAAHTWPLPAMAFVGGLGTIFLVYALARDSAGATPVHTLLLSGVMVNAVLCSVLMFLVSLSTSEKLHSVIWWLLGNLQIFDWALLRAAAIVVGAGFVATVVLSRDLNVITLGEEPAAHLGLNVELTKVVFLLLASLMTGATVAACGLIGFVGLIVPHSVRLAIGPDHRRLVPASALAGATFLVLADSVARSVIAPTEIPIGVVTALLGGPFFFFLLRRRKRSSWG